MTETNLPEGWEVVKLEDIAEIHDNRRIPLSEKERSTRKGPYPYCGANGIIDYIDDFIFDGEYLLLAEDGGDYGKYQRTAYLMDGKFWVNNHAHILKALKEMSINKFVLYYLNFMDLNPYIVGSTRRKLNQNEMRKIKLPLPPLPEQRKIAEILSSVDSAIHQTDEAILKSERLRKGLMQEILTNGIKHTKFKDTEIGRIPEEWKVVRLGDAIKEIKNGFASGKRDKKGIVQIRMNNVTTDGRLIFDSYLKVPKPENLDIWLLQKGDFLFNNTNSYELVGKSAIFTEAPFPCTFSNHFTRIRFKEGIVIPQIILYHFIMLWEKGYFKSVAIRHVGQSAVNSKYLLKIKLPLPPLSEQKKIAEILSAVDEKIALEKERKAKFERIKKGLMNDLLTGRKRVK